MFTKPKENDMLFNVDYDGTYVGDDDEDEDVFF